MLSSFLVSIAFLVLGRNGVHVSTHIALLVTIAFTTVCWVTTAFIGPETDRKTLIEFYKTVRPFGPGWKKIREEAGISDHGREGSAENIPMALLGWISGCTTIWSSLFAVGNFLYGRLNYAFILTGVFVVSALVLIRIVNRLWKQKEELA
jgi:hypothetical protein